MCEDNKWDEQKNKNRTKIVCMYVECRRVEARFKCYSKNTHYTHKLVYLLKFTWYYYTLPGTVVCVFFTLNRYFYPSTSSATSVRADSSILEEIHVLSSQSHATEILRCHVCSKHSIGQCNAMSPYWTLCQASNGSPLSSPASSHCLPASTSY